MVLLVSAAHAASLVAVVVVDREAREEGYALALEDVLVEDVLPIDVAEGEVVEIVDPDGGRHALDVAPGEAWEIAGATGEALMSRIGEDIRSDVVRIDGDRDAVEAVAAELHAKVLVDRDRTWLVRDGILFDVPWVETAGVDRVDEIALVRADEELPARTVPVSTPPPVRAVAPPIAGPVARAAVVAVAAPPSRASVPAAVAAPPVVAEPARHAVAEVARPATAHGGSLDASEYVGLYLCDNTTLNLGAGGAFAGAGKVGTWDLSAPGVIHLAVEGAVVARASIEVDRHFCRAVW